MLRIDGLNANKVLSITASETLTKEDYNRLLPELEEKLEKQCWPPTFGAYAPEGNLRFPLFLPGETFVSVSLGPVFHHSIIAFGV